MPPATAYMLCSCHLVNMTDVVALQTNRYFAFCLSK